MTSKIKIYASGVQDIPGAELVNNFGEVAGEAFCKDIKQAKEELTKAAEKIENANAVVNARPVTSSTGPLSTNVVYSGDAVQLRFPESSLE